MPLPTVCAPIALSPSDFLNVQIYVVPTLLEQNQTMIVYTGVITKHSCCHTRINARHDKPHLPCNNWRVVSMAVLVLQLAKNVSGSCPFLISPRVDYLNAYFSSSGRYYWRFN